jgi:hypothetical protein
VAARKDRGEDLFDDIALADDDLLQLFLHELAVLAEFLQDISETTGLGGQTQNPSKLLRMRGPTQPIHSMTALAGEQRRTGARPHFSRKSTRWGAACAAPARPTPAQRTVFVSKGPIA